MRHDAGLTYVLSALLDSPAFEIALRASSAAFNFGQNFFSESVSIRERMFTTAPPCPRNSAAEQLLDRVLTTLKETIGEIIIHDQNEVNEGCLEHVWMAPPLACVSHSVQSPYVTTSTVVV